MAIRFDDSLALFAQTIAAEVGSACLLRGVALRDVTGKLAFVAPDPLEPEMAERLASRLKEALGPYARADRAVVTIDDHGAKEILAEPHLLVAGPDGTKVRLVDRRLVGADWLTRPAEAAPGAPRFVFASIKGGVGRSTALAVAAAHRAAKGDRVLAIDFDLEAPGLGSILLDGDTLPEFGVLDALVEGHVGILDETFLADLVGPSALAASRGAIDVAPAFGRRSRKNPAEVLAKIARAYTERLRDDGPPATILEQVRALVDRFASYSRYDAIFVDTRAGLHETAASTILGLGAEVLLFGLDDRQTFDGYAALLAHLARFVDPMAPAPEWFLRLTMVQAKAPLDQVARNAFAERCRTLFRDVGFGRPERTGLPEIVAPSGIDLPWDDDVADEDVLPDDEWSPRSPVAVAYDEQFRGFDPLARRDLLTDRVYSATYGDLLARIDEPFRVREANT